MEQVIVEEIKKLDEIISKEKFPADVDDNLVFGWLEADIEQALINSANLEAKEEYIKNQILKMPHGNEILKMLNLKRIVESAEIRQDFAEAFRHVKDGGDLAEKIGYGFTKGDLETLARLYKARRCRNKILQLLEACNFHREAGWLANGEYSRFF